MIQRRHKRWGEAFGETAWDHLRAQALNTQEGSMAKMDWDKVRRQDSRRRNAPVHDEPRRFIMRAKHPGICAGCSLRYKELSPITPVELDGTTHWVHWSKKLTCAHRMEGRRIKERASH